MVYYDLTIDQRIQSRKESLINKKVKNIDAKIYSIESTDLKEMKWVWDETIKILFENWITSQADLLSKWKEEVDKIKVPFLSKRWVMAIFNK